MEECVKVLVYDLFSNICITFDSAVFWTMDLTLLKLLEKEN